MHPTISVIVPVYNSEDTLNRCVNSIIHQTFSNIEIILIDDGSTDRSLSICNSFACNDSRVRVKHTCNSGLSVARNTGIEMSTGDYLAFVDSDDQIDAQMLATLLKAAKTTKSEIACCGRYTVTNSSLKKQFTLNKAKMFCSNEALRELLSRGVINEAAWDKLYKRELFTDIRFPPGEINEDVVIMPKLISMASTIIHVGQPLYYYYYTPNGITKSSYSKEKSIVIKHIDLVSEYIQEKFPNLTDAMEIFEADYAVDMLEPLLDEKDNKTIFRADYAEYMGYLRVNIFRYIFCKNISTKKKLKAILLLLRLYGPIKSIKRLF